MRLRALEYVKNFWPVAATTSSPRFYADYNATHFMVAPSPDQTYDFELAYYARLDPLDATNETNWLTLNAPQCLLYACILEAQMWCKNVEKATFWQGQYEAAKGAIIMENMERINDKTQTVSRG